MLNLVVGCHHQSRPAGKRQENKSSLHLPLPASKNHKFICMQLLSGYAALPVLTISSQLRFVVDNS